MERDIILKEIGKILLPLIQLFGIYVIINGHLSPGGGFSGGTILGTSLIIMHLIYGEDFVKNIYTKQKLLLITSISLIFYTLLKGYSFISDELHLPHPHIGTPGNIMSSGFILPLNIAVGLLVASIFYIIFSIFIRDEV
ncbi:MAG: MnhB domain-containing protein [Bacillota bacterium]|nr:MnhB domain-containing protein [Bacillota bacterium]